MARHGGPADGHRRGDLLDRLVTAAQQTQDLASVGVTQRLERVTRRTGLVHSCTARLDAPLEALGKRARTTGAGRGSTATSDPRADRCTPRGYGTWCSRPDPARGRRSARLGTDPTACPPVNVSRRGGSNVVTLTGNVRPGVASVRILIVSPAAIVPSTDCDSGVPLRPARCVGQHPPHRGRGRRRSSTSLRSAASPLHPRRVPDVLGNVSGYW